MAMNDLSDIKLLIMDTADNAADAFMALLHRHRLSVTGQRVNDREELVRALGRQCWDVLLLNEGVKEVQAAECASWIRDKDWSVALVVLGQGEIDLGKIALGYGQGVAALVSPDAPDYSVAAFARECTRVRGLRRQRQLARENAELRQRYRLLLSGSRDAIAYIHEGMHVYANEAYLELFGFADMEEAAGMPFVDMIGEDCREELKAGLKRVQEGRDGTEGEVSLAVLALQGDGGQFKAELQLKPTLYDGERCLQVLVRSGGEAAAAQREPARPAPPAAAIPLEEHKAAAEAGRRPPKETIAEALAARRGELVSRPVIAVADIEPEYYEIELRLHGAGDAVFGPTEYRAVVGGDPLGQKLDQWTIEKALRLLVELNNQGESLQFFFTLSARSMTDRKFPAWLSAQVEKAGLDLAALGVNLHQAEVLADSDSALAMMADLQDAGLKICISDFSACPEMREVLEKTRPRFVKLHSAASRRIGGDESYAAELKQLVGELHAGRAKVIAAEVNDTATLSALWKADVDLVQGDLLPAGDAVNLGKHEFGGAEEPGAVEPGLQRRVGT